VRWVWWLNVSIGKDDLINVGVGGGCDVAGEDGPAAVGALNPGVELEKVAAVDVLAELAGDLDHLDPGGRGVDGAVDLVCGKAGDVAGEAERGAGASAEGREERGGGDPAVAGVGQGVERGGGAVGGTVDGAVAGAQSAVAVAIVRRVHAIKAELVAVSDGRHCGTGAEHGSKEQDESWHKAAGHSGGVTSAVRVCMRVCACKVEVVMMAERPAF
jgi:hypothetical protein